MVKLPLCTMTLRSSSAATAEAEFHIVAKALVVLVGNHRALLGFNPCIFTGDDPEAVNDENVGAEIGDAIGDVHVEAGDDAHDGDESGNGENDAEQGQEAAEFVSAQGVESEFKSFTKGDPGGAEALGACRHSGEAVQRRSTSQTVQGDYAQGELLIGIRRRERNRSTHNPTYVRRWGGGFSFVQPAYNFNSMYSLLRWGPGRNGAGRKGE